MFPAFAHFRRTATCDTELHGQTIRKGEKVVLWYTSSNRDETIYENPDHFDVRRWSNGGCSPEAGVSRARSEHQAFGAGGRHFCLGTALARLELRIMLEETLARYPHMRLADGAGGLDAPEYVESPFINQLKLLPVRLAA
jgi:cytochrome P450